MMYYKILSIAFGGFIGSLLRYKVNNYILKKADNSIPYGTIIINIIGSFFLGFIVSLNTTFMLNQYLYLLCTSGFAGAFTTFSTAMYEFYKLMEDKEYREASKYFIYTMAGGIIGSILGYWSVKFIFSSTSQSL